MEELGLELTPQHGLFPADSLWHLGALGLLEGPRQNRRENAQALWKGPGMGSVGSGAWRPPGSRAASVEPWPIHPTALDLCLLCFPLFKQYPHVTRDCTQKPTLGTNPAKGECTAQSHFSCVIRMSVAAARWGSVEMVGGYDWQQVVWVFAVTLTSMFPINCTLVPCRPLCQMLYRHHSQSCQSCRKCYPKYTGEEDEMQRLQAVSNGAQMW